MEKILRKFKVNYYLDWNGAEISQIKKDIEELEKLGATQIYLESDPYIKTIAFALRLETDEEYQERVYKYNERQEVMKQRDLELLERLKSKYEK